ncbi:hypothetical protein [Clostridium aciditolerans]|uniref:Uncharacterized protein n=1 Tax=Clostridium aciditolerans TaxID=339861 RepID=A0A934M4B1_9CLOT|nr:hypothetical protein [Clostridium aciditolerans]MBI6872428.1 hypothetical protein [Clostridium aciditolerans]
MIEELNKKISDVKEKLRTKQKFESALEQTREALKKQEIRKNELYNILNNEEKDVKNLESLSIMGLFYSILGSKEQQIEKERQEYLAAKLNYDECCSTISILERELCSYEEELKKYSTLNLEYQSLMKQKERLILIDNSIVSHKLISLMDKESDLRLGIGEVREAIKAGENAQDALKNVLKSLESAQGWGQWDIVGGGFLATTAKHSKIDEAKDYLYYAQELLRIFKRELSDVDLPNNIEINIGSFETFADYFFDGLISDWIVQSKIKDSLGKVYIIYDNVKDIINKLDIKHNDLVKELTLTGEKIKLFIEKAN